MELNPFSRAILAGIGCAAFLAFILACTSFSPDDTQVLYPVFDHSDAVSFAVYDRKTGLSESIFTALAPCETASNSAPLLTRAQWLPDGKHILLAHTRPKDDKSLSLFVIPHGVKEPIRNLGDVAVESAPAALLSPFSISGSKLVLYDEKTLLCIDLTTGQTVAHDNTNKVVPAFGGNETAISAITEEDEKGRTAFGTLDPNTMAFSPVLIFTNNICKDLLKGVYPAFNQKERQAVFITDKEDKLQLQIVNKGGVTFSRIIACASSNDTLVALGTTLNVGPRNDRLFTSYVRQTAAAKDAEYGIVEIPFNRDPLRWVPLFRADQDQHNGDCFYSQVSVSHDGQTVAFATSYMYLQHDSIKPEDCALFLVDMGPAEPKITKVPIKPPLRRRAFDN